MIGVRLPIPVVEAVKASAEREGMSVNRYVGDIITEVVSGETTAGQVPAHVPSKRTARVASTGRKSPNGEK